MEEIYQDPRDKGRATLIRKADERAQALLPIVQRIHQAGAVSLRDIAGHLNTRNIPAPRGGQWSAVQVQRMLSRVTSSTR